MPKPNRHRDAITCATAQCSCCSSSRFFSIASEATDIHADRGTCSPGTQNNCCSQDCGSCHKLHARFELFAAAAGHNNPAGAAPARKQQQQLSADSIITTRIHAAGLCCPVESRLVHSILDSIPGVLSVDVTIVTKAVDIQHSPTAISPAAMVAALNSAGLQARLNSRNTQAISTSAAAQQHAADGSQLAAATGSKGVLQSVLQLHQQHRDLLPPLTVLAAGCLLLINLLLLIPAVPAAAVLKQGLLALVAAAVGVLPVMQKAWAGLRNYNLDMNSLVVVALFGAIGLGEWFEAGALIFLFTLAEWLEERCISTAAGALEDILRLQPEWATVVVEQQQEEEELSTSSSSGSSKDAVAEVVAAACCNHGECKHHHNKPQQQQHSSSRELVAMPVSQLEVGALVLVRPGDKVPIDGVIERGSSVLDESMITGESKPITRSAGDLVLAGSVNIGSSAIQITATAAAADSTVARLAALMEAAAASKSKHESAVEKFARYYTPMVVLVALLVAVVGAAAQPQQWQQWAYVSLVVLVTGCPCALVISTPVANVAGLTCAARKGVLIKGGRYLELLGNLSTASFDKSGTLTEGHFQVSQIHTFGGYTQQQVLKLAAALEQHSNHPIAHAVVGAAAAAAGGGALPAAEVTEVAGKGVRGYVGNMRVTVGSWDFVREQMHDHRAGASGRSGAVSEMQQPGAMHKQQKARAFDNKQVHCDSQMLLLSSEDCDGLGFVSQSAKANNKQQQQQQPDNASEADIEQLLASAAAQGATAVCIAVDDRIAAVLLLSDTIRQDALQAVQQLHALGVRCVMLTGDSAGAAATVAKQLGIDSQDVYAQLLPQDKLEVLKSLQQQQQQQCGTAAADADLVKAKCIPRTANAPCIAHIGDGVNDAPALAAADVGIAMGVAGAALAVEAADVALFSNHLTSLPFAIRLGRRAAWIVGVNVAFACGIKVAVLVCAAAGAASLWLSLLADVGSSLLVTMHALTLLWFEANAPVDAYNANALQDSSSSSMWRALWGFCSWGKCMTLSSYQRLTAAGDSAAVSAAASRHDSFTQRYRARDADDCHDHDATCDHDHDDALCSFDDHEHVDHDALCDHPDHHDALCDHDHDAGCCIGLQPSDAARATAGLE